MVGDGTRLGCKVGSGGLVGEGFAEGCVASGICVFSVVVTVAELKAGSAAVGDPWETVPLHAVSSMIKKTISTKRIADKYTIMRVVLFNYLGFYLASQYSASMTSSSSDGSRHSPCTT